MLAAGCASDEPMSVRMVRSEMQRCPEASWLDGLEGKLKWNYTTGLELLSFVDVFEAYGDSSVLNYVSDWYDGIIDSAGTIYGYKLSKHNQDHVCPGRTLLSLQRIAPRPKYEVAIDTLRSQIATQPRTDQGGFWHKSIYPDQMWLDGLYMLEPFYAQVSASIADEGERRAAFDDIALQFDLAFDGCFDPQTGLLRHAFDRSRTIFWADSLTGQSAHCWGRALGWYSMALVDVLDWFPEEYDGHGDLLEKLRHILGLLPDFADPETGMWHQVLDSPGREGNYLEATCSAMFTYVYLKSVRLGYIPSDRRDYARHLYESFLDVFVTCDEQGSVTIHDCCAVAGLGGKEMRSGTFEYYVNEKIIDNDCKGVGPFIWASLEYERQ